MPINNLVSRHYELLNEVVDDCKKTGHFTTTAVDIYCQKVSEYRLAIQHTARDLWESVNEVDYAMSFVRDYIWFGDENK